eukprot:4174318-Pyramimonas_sp.AAC.1
MEEEELDTAARRAQGTTRRRGGQPGAQPERNEPVAHAPAAGGHQGAREERQGPLHGQQGQGQSRRAAAWVTRSGSRRSTAAAGGPSGNYCSPRRLRR